MTVTTFRPMPLMPFRITFDVLSGKHSQQYKRARLTALASKDNRYLVAPEKPATKLTDKDWYDLCSGSSNWDGQDTHAVIGAFLVCKHENILVGSSLVERWPEDTPQETAYYRAIFVDPAFRNIGVGEKIELFQDEWARSQGYKDVVLTVRADKERWLARQIDYFGASIIAYKSIRYANGEDAFTYVLKRNLYQQISAGRPRPLAVNGCTP